MRVMFPRPVIAVLIAIVLVAPSGVSKGKGDAEKGGDAPPVRELAVALDSYGSFDAALLPVDTDWFSTPVSSLDAGCVSVRALAPDDSSSRLVVETSRGTMTLDPAMPDGESKAGFASDSLGRSFLSVAGPVKGKEKKERPEAIEPYSFEIARITLPPAGSGDAGSGLDAGASPDAALATSDACISGSVGEGSTLAAIADGFGGSLGAPDFTDMYAVSLSDGGVTISVAASGPLEVRLLGVDGTQLGPTLGRDQAAIIDLPMAGMYNVRVDADAPVSYSIGVTDGPNPSSGCRPYCMMV